MASLVKREGNIGSFVLNIDGSTIEVKAPLKIDLTEKQKEAVVYDMIFDSIVRPRHRHKTVQEWRAMGFDIPPENVNLGNEKPANKEDTTVEPQKTTFNPIKIAIQSKTIVFNQRLNNRQNICV